MPVSKEISSECADECCERSEDDIERVASCKDVTEDASDEKSWNCCGCEGGQDGG